MGFLKKIISVLALVLIMSVLFGGLGASAVGDITDYDSYIYDAKGKAIAAPVPYEYYGSISADTLGLSGELQVVEIDKDTNGNLYLLDSKNSRVIITDSNYSLIKVIDSFEFEGERHTFSAPQGICVAKSGSIYVADTENGRIVCFDKNGTCTNILLKPEGEDVQIDYEYYPTKIQVDEFDNLYVVARDQTLGIMRITTKGEYRGYLGATRVVPSFWQIILRQFATEKQLEGLVNFIPTEYSNMDIDDNGFVYCVISAIDAKGVKADIEANGATTAPIRRLNQQGGDILVRNGLFPPVGDISFNSTGNVLYDGVSSLCDIAVYKDDIYSVLDSKRGRVFTYDGDGNLLYVFGKRSSEQGGFLKAASLIYHGDRILVSDTKTGVVQIFEPTQYAELLSAAISCFVKGDGDGEAEKWQELLSSYSGNTVIHTGIGRMQYNNGDYAKALDSFKAADNKTYYSKALKAYIKAQGAKWAPTIAAVAVIIVLAAVIMGKILRKKGISLKGNSPKTRFGQGVHDCLKGVKYSFYVSTHPFDGFNDLKFEGKGNLASAFVLWALAVVANIINMWLTPYLFNNTDITKTNILLEGVIGVSVPLLLWCISNWCFTTLMDGKGTFRDIFIFSCNCLLPIILVFPLLTGVSYFLYEGSASFANMILILAVVWMLFLFVVGTVTTHQYTLTKAILSILISLVGMLIIVFLVFLVVILVQQVITFIVQLFDELIFSMN